MQNRLISLVEQKTLKGAKKRPSFRPGDTVRVLYKIQEGSKDKKKFRLQPFEGVVIRRHRGTAGASFTVRKIGANGIGVERVFPLYSPFVDKIEVIASGLVRRSRLYYLRQLSGKAARIRSRFHGRRSEVEIPGADQEVEEVVASQEVVIDPPEAEQAAAESQSNGAPQQQSSAPDEGEGAPQQSSAPDSSDDSGEKS